MSREMVFEGLVKRGVRQAGTAYVEYHVDMNAWKNLCKYASLFQDTSANDLIVRRLKGGAPAWPWSNGPKMDDMSDGMSVAYNKWRIDHDLPVIEIVPHHHQGVAPVPPATAEELAQGIQISSENICDDSHAALPDLEPNVTPQAAPLNAHERIENPVVLDKALRQQFWETSSSGQHTGVIAGPFSLNLPVWLDFERLVLGENGHDIDAINKDILESGVAISWEISGDKPSCLVVGFKDEATSMLPQVQQHLFEVWCDIIAWFCSALSGSPVSLAPFLRVIQVVNPFMDRTPDLQNAQRLWQESLAESDLFASRAREARVCFKLWSPMIREVIQQPLGVAEESLTSWIFWEEADSDERAKRFNVARDVWLSSSSDPKVIRRASRWVQSFIANLQSSD